MTSITSLAPDIGIDMIGSWHKLHNGTWNVGWNLSKWRRQRRNLWDHQCPCPVIHESDLKQQHILGGGKISTTTKSWKDVGAGWLLWSLPLINHDGQHQGWCRLLQLTQVVAQLEPPGRHSVFERADQYILRYLTCGFGQCVPAYLSLSEKMSKQFALAWNNNTHTHTVLP